MFKRAADYCKNIRFDAHRDSAVIGNRKPRDSRVVQKRLTGEQKSSKYVIIVKTCQSKLKNIFGGFIYEYHKHRQ